MTMYALFKGEERVSKAHSTKHAVRIEAYAAGLVLFIGADFPGDDTGTVLAAGHSIREVPDGR